jgi:hypothetical protein
MAKRMISLEISEELREALRIEAFNQSLSISAVIRQILEDKLFKAPKKETINDQED